MTVDIKMLNLEFLMSRWSTKTHTFEAEWGRPIIGGRGHANIFANVRRG